MSKGNQSNSSNSTLDQLAVLGAAGSGSGNSSAQDLLARLLADKLGKEAAQEAADAEQAEAFRTAQLSAIKQQMVEREQQQDACPHMKPNFRPALGGQKDHKGNYHFICQYCAKEFGNDVPYHLRIPGEMIGGPQ